MSEKPTIRAQEPNLNAVRRGTTLIVALIGALNLVATPANAATCDRAPPNHNPAAVMPTAFSPVASAVNRNFSTAAGSQRWYDLIDGLDGVTLGFGNWPQQEVAGFFADMAKANGGAALAALETCLTDFFRADAPAWRALQAAARTPETSPDAASVADAITRTVLSEQFMHRYRQHCAVKCKLGEPNLFAEQKAWFVPAMRDAFRDRTVIAWQVDFWSRTIVKDAVDATATLGLARDDEAAVVATAAYISSSPGWLTGVTRAARGGGRVDFNGRVWDWNHVPPGLAGADWLRRWRLLILWQVYSNHVEVVQQKRSGKWSFRDRSRLFWSDYLAPSWMLPALDRRGTPDWRSDDNLRPELVKPVLSSTGTP